MKLLIFYLIISWTSRIVCALDISEDDLYLFLPFLQNQTPPPPCPPNELYKTCVSNCSDCTQRGSCPITQCIDGCDCAPRFYRVTPGGPCEPVANCPKPECGENEVFRECGPVCERCTTFRCHVVNCDHKCYCKEGYRRNKEGVCIPEDQCPKRKRCSRTEEKKESGLIDEFCLKPQGVLPNNDTQNVEGCYCKDGYKRNSLGYCIVENLCPLIKCPGVEVYVDCIPRCNTTCRNYGNADCIEDDNCYSGCFCPPGYVMNDFRTCVLIEECSLDIEHILVLEPFETSEGDVSSNAESTTAATFDKTNNDSSAAESSVKSESEATNTNTTQESEIITSEDADSVASNKSEASATTGEYDSESAVTSSVEPNNDQTASTDNPVSDAGDESSIVSTKETSNEQNESTTEVSLSESDRYDEDDFDNENF